MPGPDAATLWKYITQESPYTQWAFWPDHEGMQPGQYPHGAFHEVYVNMPVLDPAKPTFPTAALWLRKTTPKKKWPF